MAYQSLYRKYRPKTFADVVGQSTIVELLTKSIDKDKISHAYLFCGPRGTGKTSMAKLLAMAINCTSQEETLCGVCDNCQSAQENQHPDSVEIDAASNNGVDEIRGLIERVKFAPVLGKKKVYIIDEVHMLSQGAFNALLKTLEEPPEHVVFILATTEVHKVLPTIISRCQRFDFTRIETSDIAGRLDVVLEQEGQQAESGVTELIASLSGGGLRNALTILEQAIILADDTITVEQITTTFGMITLHDKIQLFTSLVQGDVQQLITTLEAFKERSVNIERVLLDLITNIKDSLILKRTQSKEFMDKNQEEFIEMLSLTLDDGTLQYLIDQLLTTLDRLKFSQNQGVYFEVCFLEILEHLHPSSAETIAKSTQLEAITAPVEKKPKKKTREPLTEQKTESTVRSKETDTKKKVVVSDVEAGFDIEKAEETLDTDVSVTPSETAEKDSIDETMMDRETLIRFMVSADKTMRLEDAKKAERIADYRTDIKWAKVSRLLTSGSLILSGSQFVMFNFKSDYEVREVMDVNNHQLLRDFAEVIFGKRKFIYAVSTTMYKETVQTFVELQKTHHLPEPFTEDAFVEEIKILAAPEVRDETLTQLTDLFGESFEVVE